jgi:hypothetical protein
MSGFRLDHFEQHFDLAHHSELRQTYTEVDTDLHINMTH